MIEKEILFKPEGVCSKSIRIVVSENEGTSKEDSLIKEVTFVGGCPGNAIGLARAIENRSVKSIISLLKDIKCGIKDTSCPAQLSKALEEYIND